MNSIFRRIVNKIRGESDIDRLIQDGLRVGKNFHMQPHCRIDPSFCWLVFIGDNVTLAPNVSIIAHDASTKPLLGYTKIGLVSIGDNAFIGQNSTILPNVRIGSNCIVGAGSVVKKDIPDNCIYAGNPAHFICRVEDFINRNKTLIMTRPIYDFSWTMQSKVSSEKKARMVESLKDGIGFIE